MVANESDKILDPIGTKLCEMGEQAMCSVNIIIVVVTGNFQGWLVSELS
jgi:hypothetical protein